MFPDYTQDAPVSLHHDDVLVSDAFVDLCVALDAVALLPVEELDARPDELIVLASELRALAQTIDERLGYTAENFTPRIVPVNPVAMRPRPPVLYGYTRNITAPEGTAHITINSDDEGPLEMFVTVGRAGSDIAALAEALGRLASLFLRVPSSLDPDRRLELIENQLSGLGGSGSVGFGPNRVLSLPDATARALRLHRVEREKAQVRDAGLERPEPDYEPVRLTTRTGNICPDCKNNSVAYEEGCKKCLGCGWSSC